MKGKKITKVVGKALDVVIGGGKRHQFIGAAEKAKVPPYLKTQADGRKYAITFLEALEAMQLDDYAFAANATETDDGKTVVRRKGPQSQFIREVFDTVYAAPEEARRGFFQIITDQFGTAPAGWYDPNAYRELEKAGHIKRRAGRVEGTGPDALQGDPAPNQRQKRTAERGR